MSAETWEGAIRAVTMAGRPDRLYQLQLRWNSTVEVLDAIARDLRAVRARVSPEAWQGTGADAYRRHLDGLLRRVDEIIRRAGTAVTVSGAAAGALAEAIGTIPLPDMGDPTRLGSHTIRPADAEHGNQVQYDFYTDHRDRYADGGFLAYVRDRLTATHDLRDWLPGGHGNAWTEGGAGIAQRWYAANTRVARGAVDRLADAYRDHANALPVPDTTADQADGSVAPHQDPPPPAAPAPAGPVVADERAWLDDDAGFFAAPLGTAHQIDHGYLDQRSVERGGR